MGMRDVERIIVLEARRELKNSKVRLKDLKEWSNAPITAPSEADEVVLELDTFIGRFWASFPRSTDKRPAPEEAERARVPVS